jgi:hypothetical protein
MIKHYAIILFSICIVFQVSAQKKSKSPAKPKQETAPAEPGKNQTVQKEEDLKSRESLKRYRRILAAKKASKYQSNFDSASLQKVLVNLSDDGAGNLTKPIIILPFNLADPDQNNIFLQYKTLVESDRPTSTFIVNLNKKLVAFVINSKESYLKWMESNPTLISAYVFEGIDALNASQEKFVIVRRNEGLAKFIELQVIKRVPKGVFSPMAVPEMQETSPQSP